MNRLFTFEAFTKEYLDKMIDNKDTYLFKNIRSRTTLNKIDLKIKKYNYSNFTFDDKKSYITIYPDENFIKLCKLKKIDINYFRLTILNNSNFSPFPNKIDFESGIPKTLQGLSVGYNLYKITIKSLKFITSDGLATSDDAKNLWYNLSQDSDFYSGTNKFGSILIFKNIEDYELKGILEKVAHLNLKYDNELESKMKKNLNNFQFFKSIIDK